MSEVIQVNVVEAAPVVVDEVVVVIKDPAPPPPVEVRVSGQGQRGASNYDLWLSQGNTGTLEDYMLSLKGDPAIVNLATDPDLGDSDLLAPSQNAVKTHVGYETEARILADQGLQDAVDQINLLLASDDVTLDQLQEIVEFIKANRSDIDALGVSSIFGLQTLLDALSGRITDEASRAASAEETIEFNLAEEVQRAQQAESDLAGQVTNASVSGTITTQTPVTDVVTGDEIPVVHEGLLTRIAKSNFVTWVKGFLGSFATRDFTMSDTAPTDPSNDDVWLRTTDMKVFLRFSGAWICLNGTGVTHDMLQTVLNSGNYAFGGQLTANGQPAPSLLSANDVMTKVLAEDAFWSIQRPRKIQRFPLTSGLYYEESAEAGVAFYGGAGSGSPGIQGVGATSAATAGNWGRVVISRPNLINATSGGGHSYNVSQEIYVCLDYAIVTICGIGNKFQYGMYNNNPDGTLHAAIFGYAVEVYNGGGGTMLARIAAKPTAAGSVVYSDPVDVGNSGSLKRHFWLKLNASGALELRIAYGPNPYRPGVASATLGPLAFTTSGNGFVYITHIATSETPAENIGSWSVSDATFELF
jgi:hypothetical protein